MFFTETVDIGYTDMEAAHIFKSTTEQITVAAPATATEADQSQTMDELADRLAGTSI